MHLIEPTGIRALAELDPEPALPLSDYLEQSNKQAAVELATDSDLDSIAQYFEHIPQLFIRLESFADGRGFSLAHRLRHHYGYRKPIWAIGHLIADQFPHALRCGFDAAVITDEQLQRQPFEHWQDALAAAPIPYRCQEEKTQKKSNLSVNEQTITQLNEKYRKLPTEQLLRDVFVEQVFGKTALVSSFGAESGVLLHHLAILNPDAPVLFIDTGKLFSHTLTYQQELTEKLTLTNVQVLTPDEARLHQLDAFGVLYKSDVDSCCHIRKVEPLQNALKHFDSWVSGRKSYQNESRQNLAIFEKSGVHIKINPLANWTKKEVTAYMKEHDIPEHPLQKSGYESIGCAPCTTPVSGQESQRNGRWRGQDKTECGIHFIDGQVQRNEAKQPTSESAAYAAVGDSWAY